MALSGSRGLAGFGGNDLRFLDELGFPTSHHYKPQSAAFSVPILEIDIDLPEIGERPPQWYEAFCPAQPRRVKATRKRTRNPQPKKPTSSKPTIPKPVKPKPVKPKPIPSAPTDDCLLPLTPVPNPMPFLQIIHVPLTPPTLPSGIRAVRLAGKPLWATSELPIWVRPEIRRIPPNVRPSLQPPWTDSGRQSWNKSATLQPGWARSLVHLGRILQDLGERKKGETQEMVAAKGAAFGKQIERKCVCLGHLMGECVQALENRGNARRNLGDNV